MLFPSEELQAIFRIQFKNLLISDDWTAIKGELFDYNKKKTEHRGRINIKLEYYTSG